jgi:hypothetical protein
LVVFDHYFNGAFIEIMVRIALCIGGGTDDYIICRRYRLGINSPRQRSSAFRSLVMFYYPALSSLTTKAPTIEALIMIVMRRLLFLPVCAAVSLSGCITWGSKMAMGDQHHASVKTEHVVILFEKPTWPYKEIGLVSSLGGWFASDGDNYHKMQMAAAALGADAVIVRGEDTQTQRDYWQYPKTSGIAIKYTD